MTALTPEQLAQQIIDLTRVVTDADSARPGKPVSVQVLPGFVPSLPVSSTLDDVRLVSVPGSVNPIEAKLTGTLDTLVNAVSLTVSYEVKRGDGSPAADTELGAALPE
ncbi:hypothetical protein AB0G73_33290 [Streptomyces sp. NPDC020719]|uniref:hypothetical protein n=1 Tax=Streptomyces sp. NPDC020719 TaxID=3154896 RepID=UPI0033C87710